MKRKKASKGILIDIALLLACLMCITTCISSGILAKYTSGGNGNKSAKIAGFSVSASGSPNNNVVEIDDEHSSAKYDLVLTNESETAVRYDIVLKFDVDVNNKITVKYDDIEYSTVTDDNKTIKITNAGTLDANLTGSKTVNFDLIVDLDGFSAQSENGEDFVNFDTIVCFTQID